TAVLCGRRQIQENVSCLFISSAHMSPDLRCSLSSVLILCSQMGQYVRELLTDNNYFGTIFKRLPLKLTRDVQKLVRLSARSRPPGGQWNSRRTARPTPPP